MSFWSKTKTMKIVQDWFIGATSNYSEYELEAAIKQLELIAGGLKRQLERVKRERQNP